MHEKVLGKPHKTLFSHSLDAGYTCEYLLTKTTYNIQVVHLAKSLNLEIKDVIITLSYLCAMHDAGKLHPFFQAKLFDKDCSVKDEMELIYGGKIHGYEGYRHEYGSKEILHDVLKDKNIDRRCRSIFAAVVDMHHQGHGKGSEYRDSDASIKNLPEVWGKELVIPFCNDIWQEFNPDIGVIKKMTSDMPVWVFNEILGILMTCDWIASGQRFMEIDVKDFQTVRDYKSRVIEILDNMSDEVDLSYKNFMGDYSYKSLFGIDNLRTMQKTVIDALHDHPNFDCILIEAPTGEGKSEAALFAAMQTIKTRGLQGMYFALPTGVTSEAMLPRLTEMLKRIGEDTNVALTTGTAWLSNLNDDIAYQDMIFRRFKLLERFCVGTVDQIMSAATLSYYAEIKMAAMGSKVVVIDEVHSYDAYMMAVMEMMLRYFKEMKIPVIMLSATLSDRARTKILSYYGITKQNYIDSYPKICVIENNLLTQYGCKPSDRKKEIRSTVEDGELEDFYQKAIDKVKTGGCLAFITNSVKSAVSSYQDIKNIAKESGQDIELFLLHARFPMSMKEEKIEKLVSLFGKDRSKRPHKAIVVATPMIEMSMDLDFDFMYRQIAPVDAIIQSIGRIARHDDNGTVRENGVCPEIVVMKTRKGLRIYADHNHKEGDCVPILDISAKILSEYNSILIPQDVPKMINDVYDDPELADYYDKERLSEIAGSIVTSNFMPESTVSPIDISKESERKMSHAPTRESSVQYYKVAIMDDDMIEKAKSTRIKDIRELYRNTVVIVPEWDVENVKLKSGKDLGLSPWFDDVLIDEEGHYFELNQELGFRRNA